MTNLEYKNQHFAVVVLLLLLMVSNDVEKNPGPQQGERNESSERSIISRLEKELNATKRLVEKQGQQIESLLHSKHGNRVENELGKLQDEVIMLKETSSIQNALTKKHKSELATFEYDLASLKKLFNQLKTDFKHVSSISMNDLKSIKETCAENETHIRNERMSKEELKNTVWSLGKTLKLFIEGEKANILGLKKDFEDLREVEHAQVSMLKTGLDGVATDLTNLKTNYESTKNIVNENLVPTVENIDSEWKAFKKLDIETKVQELSDGIDSASANKSLEFLKLKDMVYQQSKSQEEFNSRFEEITNNAVNENQTIRDITKKLNVNEAKLNDVIHDIGDQLEQSAKSVDDEILKSTRNLRIVAKDLENKLDSMSGQIEIMTANERNHLNAVAQEVCERMDELDGMYDDMQDRVFEIDKNRKNNLVFYGVKGKEGDQDECEQTIKHIMNVQMQVTREIPLTKVIRLWNGPSFRGVKPILVSFQLYKDKEEILRKNSMLLKGTNIYVTEDFSRKVRKHREALLKYAREIRSKQPHLKCSLQYDRLMVENDIYLYNEVEERVEKVLMKVQAAKGNLEAKLLNKRPSLSEAMLECIPIKIDEFNANLPPPTYGTVPYSRGGRTSPSPHVQVPPTRDGRIPNEGMYGAVPNSRGEVTSQVVRSNVGRYPEDIYYGAVPPSRGGRTSPSNYGAIPPSRGGRVSPSRGGRVSPSYASSTFRFSRAKTIDINTATLELLSTATQTDPYLLPSRSRRRSSSCDCKKERKVLNIKEGTFSALERSNIESSPQVGPEYDNDLDEGRSTLHSSATIESHHHFTEASGNPMNNNTSGNNVLMNNLDLGETKLTIRLPKINDIGALGANGGQYNGNGARPNATFLPMPTRKN